MDHIWVHGKPVLKAAVIVSATLGAMACSSDGTGETTPSPTEGLESNGVDMGLFIEGALAK